jgi:hypothetical protein
MATYMYVASIAKLLPEFSHHSELSVDTASRTSFPLSTCSWSQMTSSPPSLVKHPSKLFFVPILPSISHPYLHPTTIHLNLPHPPITPPHRAKSSIPHPTSSPLSNSIQHAKSRDRKLMHVIPRPKPKAARRRKSSVADVRAVSVALLWLRAGKVYTKCPQRCADVEPRCTRW